MTNNYLDQSTTVEVKDPTFRTVVQEGGLELLPNYLDEEGLSANRAFVITDSNVDGLYGSAVARILDGSGVDATFMTMEAGEEHKTLDQVGSFVEELSEAKANRNDTVIALGGGVVGDLGGFVAAIYNRGVPLVHVPTTLLAMVDSSVGGKTGVDHGGKNKTGAFYQPELVVADPEVLSTLDERTYTEGLGEVAKYAVIDADFFSELEQVVGDVRRYSAGTIDVIGKMIARCVNQKSGIIKADPFEQAPNGRILLNYGHTLGHGLEAAGGFTELLHGEAVSIGMMYAAGLSGLLGLTSSQFIEQQEAMLQELGLPTKYEGNASLDDIMSHIAKDKKNTSGGTTRFVLPSFPGTLHVQQVDNDIVRGSVAEFLKS